MDQLEQIKQEALEELQGLYDYWDDGFVIKDASPNEPLSYPVVKAIWYTICDALCDADLWEERKQILEWFKEEASNILWDRVGKIDWKAREETRRKLRDTLERYCKT